MAVADHDHISRSRACIEMRKWIKSKRAPKKYGDKVAVDNTHRVKTVSLWPVR
ncbi:hypothetical protein [Microvirga sp. KLBC 81]|uniref:terminase small subunit-like protein n=1 Tax=Microvirga sp. KLBC 81 TaxID=1862707 RepID=UPI00352DE33E